MVFVLGVERSSPDCQHHEGDLPGAHRENYGYNTEKPAKGSKYFLLFFIFSSSKYDMRQSSPESRLIKYLSQIGAGGYLLETLLVRPYGRKSNPKQIFFIIPVLHLRIDSTKFLIARIPEIA